MISQKSSRLNFELAKIMVQFANGEKTTSEAITETQVLLKPLELCAAGRHDLPGDEFDDCGRCGSSCRVRGGYFFEAPKVKKKFMYIKPRHAGVHRKIIWSLPGEEFIKLEVPDTIIN